MSDLYTLCVWQVPKRNPQDKTDSLKPGVVANVYDPEFRKLIMFVANTGCIMSSRPPLGHQVRLSQNKQTKRTLLLNIYLREVERITQKQGARKEHPI